MTGIHKLPPLKAGTHLRDYSFQAPVLLVKILMSKVIEPISGEPRRKLIFVGSKPIVIFTTPAKDLGE